MGGERRRTEEEIWGNPEYSGRWQISLCNFLGGGEGEGAPGWYNLHVGVVARHRLDNLNTSNNPPQKK